MGILSGLLGNASLVEANKVAEGLAPILARGETVEVAFRVIRDEFIFTDKRLILIDKQGLTGKKVEYLSIPYRAVTRFSVETAGHFDLDAELKIWVSGDGEPVSKTLRGSENVTAIQKTLATAVLGTL
ncbi:PH domain-containing protein [Thiohalocapsa marina]|uniref:PH domain-containing protein n=1 Tax=Thiohalocapsa marina TaxID=424902 RepID=A0A5M8FW29_9GAMM|nr:PH domain-containing protein [Thiohalocapsa marina]KAA6187929.1 PH domain-containing protein [Thiohalocapsa marina]